MSEGKKSDSDQFLLFVISIVLACIVINKYGPPFIHFLLRHKYWVSAGVSAIVTSLWIMIRNRIVAVWEKSEREHILFKRQDRDSILAGWTKKGQSVFIPFSSRKMHAQVVGTTNAGKTESVILPWAIADIKEGRGLILIDGKSDRSLLDKVYAYAVKYKRADDFKLLSLVNIRESSTFNPLIGGSPEEITERVFSAFDFKDEYYRNQQYEVLKHVLIIFSSAKICPTFQRLIQAISDPDVLSDLVEKADPFMKDWVTRFCELPKDERERRTSGLVTQLGHFATGETSILFNDESPMIDVEDVLRDGLIVYCQLPVLKTPVLGKASGKMILQALQSAVSTRHLKEDKGFGFFGVYLDDFTEYLTPGFVSLLNKSRSGNIGVTFAHQAHGDLAGLGQDVRNSILTNSNLKVFMRTNEPDTAEYFSRTLGTKQSEKRTDRQRMGLLGREKTGDGSVRDVEEFNYHPNLFKRELGTGEGIMVVPVQNGSQAVRLKFAMLPDLPALRVPKIDKFRCALLPKPKKEKSQKGDGRDSQPKKPVEQIEGALEKAV